MKLEEKSILSKSEIEEEMKRIT